MLTVRVKDIPPEGKERLLPLSGEWFVTSMAGVDGAWAEASGELPVHLSRQGAEVLCRGEVRARFTVPCARCLEPALVEVSSPFATTFVPAGSVPGGDDDPDVATYAGDVIDLGALAREHVILGTPISALCRPDCKGLCSRCGADLNQGPCSCPPLATTLGAALKKVPPLR
jgi:uncharacterized protein